MKKNTLYTANPWNIGGLQLEIGTKKNLYGLGAEMKKANTYLNDDKHSTLKGAILAASNVVGGLAGTGISDGFSTGAGAAIGTLGNAAGNIVGQFNPVAGAAINIGSSVLGGLTNRAFGVKTNEAALRAANEGTAALSGFRSNANSFDEIQGPQTFAPVQDAYKGGWFSGSKARRRNAELRRQRQDALSWAGRSVDNNIDNLIDDQMNNALANYAAYGGPMDFGTGALGLMQQNRYFDSIDKRTEAIANRNMGSYGLGSYAFGGELGTNGTDFTNGLLYIDEGGTHESNPLEGVPMGMDAEGNPNLVEEGETVYNDYVFSNRIMVPESLQKDLGLGNVGKKGITFADASKKLAKESEQRPNDPISQDGLEASLSKLAAVQEAERMKQQMEEYATGLQEFACGGKMKKYGFGGNLFAGGGALEWLNKNHSDISTNVKKAIAKVMEHYVPKGKRADYLAAYNLVTKGSKGDFFRSMALGDPKGVKRRSSEENKREHFQELVDAGMDKRIAFGIAFPKAEKIVDPNAPQGYEVKRYKDDVSKRNALYDELVRGNKTTAKSPATSTPASTTQNNPNNTTETRVVQQGSQATIRNANAANKAFREGIDQGLASINTQPVAPAAPVTTSSGSSQAASTYTPASVYQGIEGINPYDWYRNGSDGYSTPTGFTVGNNGLIRPEDYTQEYRDLVSRLGADDIRKWAAEHPNDPSLLSFLARGNRLEDLTNDQWRRGATDGKYGFMHHVADQILQGQNNNAAQAAVIGEPVDAGMSDRQRYYPQASDFQGASNGSYIDWLAKAMQNPMEAFAAKEGGEDAGDKVEDTKPKEYDTWMRYAPVAGAGLMTLTDALGFTNRPDYSYADTLEAAASRAGYAPNITYEPIGDYMRYTPFDRLFFANQLQANARATDRALANTSSPSKAAGMIANGYNTTNALGNLYRQAEEYNLAQRQQVADFNRKTNMFNSQMGLEADMANARYRQSAAQMGLSGLAQAAALRDTIDQRVGAAKAMNLNNLLTSLGNIGRENYILNQINSDRGWGYAANNNGTSDWKGEKPKKYGGKMNKRKK